jgi:hypothetical protein
MSDLETLRELEYQRRLEVERLRRAVYEAADPAAGAALLPKLLGAEKELAAAEKERAAAQRAVKGPAREGVIFNTSAISKLAGAQTTGLEATVELQMAQLPTALCHLFDPDTHPLIKCVVKNTTESTRRVRVTSRIEDYSAAAVDTAELKKNAPETFLQLPTLFPERAAGVRELTRATLSVLVEDLDYGKVEVHRTRPIWLLARTTAPLAVRDPVGGGWQDLTRYFGAFVTPNAPELMTFLRAAAALRPGGLIGYQGQRSEVEPQVEALFDALRNNAKLTYVNSVIAFSPEEGAPNQRVRLPRESLKDGTANCIDGVVLFASLLEGISLSPALVIIPGHALVAWEKWEKEGEWDYLETTMIGGTQTFAQARDSGRAMAELFKQLAQETGDDSKFRLWPLRTLRAEHRITPME